MTRQQALLLGDMQTRYSTPIFQSAPAWPLVPPVPSEASTNSNGSAESKEANIDRQGAAALKGLGAGLMQRNRTNPPPPPT